VAAELVESPMHQETSPVQLRVVPVWEVISPLGIGVEVDPQVELNSAANA
jgi:hypothetical protein